MRLQSLVCEMQTRSTSPAHVHVAPGLPGFHQVQIENVNAEIEVLWQIQPACTSLTGCQTPGSPSKYLTPNGIASSYLR